MIKIILGRNFCGDGFDTIGSAAANAVSEIEKVFRNSLRFIEPPDYGKEATFFDTGFTPSYSLSIPMSIPFF